MFVPRKKETVNEVTNKFIDNTVDFIEKINGDMISENMKRISRLAIIDTLGVALAGMKEPSVQTLQRTFAKRNSNMKEVLLWGSHEKVSLEHAALINGTATHALDFDDVSPSILAHPSAPIIAGILPVAEYKNKTIKEVITAYVVGTTIMTTLGQVLGQRHYDLGWHATSTLGTIGTTAAIGKLLHLGTEELKNALSISASMSSGLQKNFGTMTKPLHVGMSAQSAIQASLLAKEGFEGNSQIFDDRGFFYAFSGGRPHESIQAKLQEIDYDAPHDFEVNGLSVKRFPCCYLTHRIIDGMLSIHQEHAINLTSIKEIIIEVPPKGLIPLIYNRPTTGLEGKFSAEYTSLAALADGEIGLQSFTDEEVQRNFIQNALSIVKTKEYKGKIENSTELERLPVYIQIKMRDGAVIEKKILHAPGSKEKPMKLTEFEEKWKDCLSYRTEIKTAKHQLDAFAHLFHVGYEMKEDSQLKEWLLDISDELTSQLAEFPNV